MVDEIGRLIFVEILKMSEYPGSPFSGNMFNDIIMFLIAPTAVMIMAVYMGVGRILPSTYTKMRLMFSIVVYLFIVAAGYFRVFAYFTQAYMIVVIFVFVLLFFVLEHFGIKRGGGTHSSGSGAGTAAHFGGPFVSGDHGQSPHVNFAEAETIVERFNPRTNEERLKIAQKVEDLMVKSHGNISLDQLYQMAHAELELEKRIQHR